MTLTAYVFPKLLAAKNVVRQMSKKPCLRTLLDSQHAKEAQTLTKSAQQPFYNISPALNRIGKCFS